jgi:hypothetical protein
MESQAGPLAYPLLLVQGADTQHHPVKAMTHDRPSLAEIDQRRDRTGQDLAALAF